MESKIDFSMLNLMPVPAFCVKDGTILYSNPLAAPLLPDCPTPIQDLLATGKTEYEVFSSGCLMLTLALSDQKYPASVFHAEEYDLFVLDTVSEEPELNALSLAARDLRQPLASMLASYDRLSCLSQEQADIQPHLTKLNHSLHQMLRLIGNMSDAIQYSTQRSVSLETINICAVLQEICSKTQNLMLQKNIQMEYHLPEPIFCLADSDKLERAIYNLLANAAKFTSENGTIDLRLIQKNKTLYLSVQNSCSSMQAEQLTQFFTRYKRSSAIEDHRFGIGLGMSLVRSVAAIHGGTVLIDYPEKNSIRFTMSLECKRSTSTQLNSKIFRIDYTGERDHALIELSDSLPSQCYQSE